MSSKTEQLSNGSNDFDRGNPFSSPSVGDNFSQSVNGDGCSKAVSKSTAIKSRRLRIPNTCSQLDLLLGTTEDKNQLQGKKILQRPSRLADLTYENSPPKRNKSFIYKSCKLEKGKIEQDCNLPQISEEQVMPSLPIEMLNKNEKLRKSSSYVFHQAHRRDSVVAKEFSDSDRSETRRTSFAAPHKRRNSRYDIHRISTDESVEWSFDHIQDVFKDRQTISTSLQAQRLETDGRNYVCVSLDSIRRALSEVGVTSGSACIRSFVGQSYLVFNCQENQLMPPEKEGKDSDTMPPLVSETQKCKQPSIEELIKLMKERPQDVKAQLTGCRCMGQFAYDDSLSVLLAKNEGISCLMTAMVKFTGQDEIVTSAISSLARMCAASDASCVHVQKNDGISELLRLMTSNRDLQVIEGTVDILGSMSAVDQTAKNVMYIGGVHVIINVMKKFQNEDLVHENACRALGSFAAHEDLCSDVSNAGALNVVMHTLKTFSDSTAVLECALWALACLSKCKKAQKQFIQDGKVKIVLERMTTYLDCPVVQEHGSLIIGTLAVSKSHRSVLERLNASQTIVTALLHHEKSDRIHENGQIALTNLSAEVYGNKYTVVKNGGVQAAITSLTKMSHNPDVVDLALKLLGNLIELGITTSELDAIERVICTVPDVLQNNNGEDVYLVQFYEKVVSTVNGCKMFVDCGSFDKMVDLLTINSTTYDVQFHGCKVMAALAMNGFHKKRSSEVLSLIHNVMRNFPGKLDLHIVCCGALCYLTEEQDSTSMVFLHQHGMSTLMTTLRRFQDEHRLVVVAFMALENLLKSVAANEDNDKLIKSYDVKLIEGYDVLSVIDIMSRFPDVVDIQVFGCKLLTLATDDDMKKELDTTPLLDILDRRKSMQDAVMWARRALQRIRPGGYQRSTQ
uniref:LRRK2 ARM repeat domain-containing protein n=1 Tax=Magallana gigas TaxID=29159 RepID=K1QVN3_MAGGI